MEGAFKVRRTHNAVVLPATDLRSYRRHNLRTGTFGGTGRRRKRYVSAYVYIPAIRIRLYGGVRGYNRQPCRSGQRKRRKTIVRSADIPFGNNIGDSDYSVDMPAAVVTRSYKRDADEQNRLRIGVYLLSDNLRGDHNADGVQFHLRNTAFLRRFRNSAFVSGNFHRPQRRARRAVSHRP